MLLDREFPPDLRVENEIEALTTEGHHVFLACYTRKNFPLTEQEGNFTILRHPISKFIYKSSVAALTKFYHFTPSYLKIHLQIKCCSADISLLFQILGKVSARYFQKIFV